MIGPSPTSSLVRPWPRRRVHEFAHLLGASTVPVGGPGLGVEALGFVLDLEDGLRYGRNRHSPMY